MANLNELTSATPAKPTGVFRILDLPAELVFGILSFLDHGEVALFSLTCKVASLLIRDSDFGKICLASLHSALLTRQDSPFQRPKLFLQLLAKDLPYHFVCQRCLKLHSHRSLIQDPVRSHQRLDLSNGLMTFGPLWPQYAFSSDEICEVLRYHHTSKASGLPLSHLAISTDWKLARLGASCNNPNYTHGYAKLDTEAVIVNNNLFFHKTQRILLLPGDVKVFIENNSRTAMEQVFNSCCHGVRLQSCFYPDLRDISWGQHISKNISVRDMISGIISMTTNRLRVKGRDTFRSSPGYPGLPGCRHCITDELITMHNHGREGVEIIFDVFQDLGQCMPPILVSSNWAYCWSRDVDLGFNSVRKRRQTHREVDPSIFPTPPGRSAREHPSKPSAQDMWELGEHERQAKRRARSAWRQG
ncbi:hypothetical protein F4819DRAFT_439731 [Hypoxylon fuscum]|nr:hypothetical protein F4819DRAFT_439731 [Hypoxylon fuscum]